MQKMWTDSITTALLGEESGHNNMTNIFLLNLERLDISNTSSFYQPVLCAWKSVLAIRRDSSQLYGEMGEGPLIYNRGPVEKCCQTQSGDWHQFSASTEQTIGVGGLLYFGTFRRMDLCLCGVEIKVLNRTSLVGVRESGESVCWHWGRLFKAARGLCTNLP